MEDPDDCCQPVLSIKQMDVMLAMGMADGMGMALGQIDGLLLGLRTKRQ